MHKARKLRDLACECCEKYGAHYADHFPKGKLFDIVQRNNFPSQHWDSDASDYVPNELPRCRLKLEERCKVIQYIMQAFDNGTLRTKPPGEPLRTAAPDSTLLTATVELSPQPAAKEPLSESWPTSGDLAEEGGISLDTFSRIRMSAGIAVDARGGAARNRRYSPMEVSTLIKTAISGNFLERRELQKKWAKWTGIASE